MVKRCVKKPFTVLVAVMIALVLGAVCMMRMTTDLLPESKAATGHAKRKPWA